MDKYECAYDEKVIILITAVSTSLIAIDIYFIFRLEYCLRLIYTGEPWKMVSQDRFGNAARTVRVDQPAITDVSSMGRGSVLFNSFSVKLVGISFYFRYKFEIFYTEWERGWGVRAKHELPAGTFIGEYFFDHTYGI